MTEVTDELTHTVAFSRKKSDDNYGSSEATFFLQFSTSRDADFAEIAEKATAASSAAKAVVYDELGIPYQVVDNHIAEVDAVTQINAAATPARVQQAFNGSAAPAPAAESVADSPQPAAPSSPDGSNAVGVGAAPPYPPEEAAAARNAKDYTKANMNEKWARARFETHPNEFWDNRPGKADGSKSAKAPDFKHKELDIAVWPSRF